MANAHHEAGHAVVAWQQRCRVDWVSVTDRRPELDFGEPRRNLNGVLIRRGRAGRQWPLAFIRVALAGGIAQRWHRPSSFRDVHASLDAETAEKCEALLPLPPANADLFRRAIFDETQHIVFMCWEHVEVIADALASSRRLSGAEIDSICRSITPCRPRLPAQLRNSARRLL